MQVRCSAARSASETEVEAGCGAVLCDVELAEVDEEEESVMQPARAEIAIKATAQRKRMPLNGCSSTDALNHRLLFIDYYS